MDYLDHIWGISVLSSIVAIPIYVSTNSLWRFSFFSHILPTLVIWFCSVAKSCLTLGDPMDCSTLGFLVLHYLLEFAQTHVHWVGDDIQISSCWTVVAELWKSPGFLGSRREEFSLGPVTFEHSVLLCNKVLLKYKRDRENFWHRHEKGAKRVPPASL